MAFQVVITEDAERDLEYIVTFIYGIAVNGMALGPTWTPLQVSGGAQPEKQKQFGAQTPLGLSGYAGRTRRRLCAACRQSEQLRNGPGLRFRRRPLPALGSCCHRAGRCSNTGRAETLAPPTTWFEIRPEAKMLSFGIYK
jgi:hypothetical protein